MTKIDEALTQLRIDLTSDLLQLDLTDKQAYGVGKAITRFTEGLLEVVAQMVESSIREN